MSRTASRRLVPPAFPHCIFVTIGSGTDRDNHRQDQVALNVVLHRKENRGHFWVEPARIYWRTAPDAEHLIPEDPTGPSLNSTLYVRRGFQPKNYAQFLNERPDTRYPGMVDDL